MPPQIWSDKLLFILPDAKRISYSDRQRTSYYASRQAGRRCLRRDRAALARWIRKVLLKQINASCRAFGGNEAEAVFRMVLYGTGYPPQGTLRLTTSPVSRNPYSNVSCQTYCRTAPRRTRYPPASRF